MLVLSLPAFENKKYAAHDRFHGNGPYGEIPTKKEPIRTLGFALPYNKEGYSIYYKKWHDAGLAKIEDFFQGNRFQTFEEFCIKFKIKLLRFMPRSSSKVDQYP